MLFAACIQNMQLWKCVPSLWQPQPVAEQQLTAVARGAYGCQRAPLCLLCVHVPLCMFLVRMRLVACTFPHAPFACAMLGGLRPRTQRAGGTVCSQSWRATAHPAPTSPQLAANLPLPWTRRPHTCFETRLPRHHAHMHAVNGPQSTRAPCDACPHVCSPPLHPWFRPRPAFNPQRYTLSKIIGHGAYAKVYEGQQASTGQLVAVKVVQKVEAAEEAELQRKGEGPGGTVGTCLRHRCYGLAVLPPMGAGNSWRFEGGDAGFVCRPVHPQNGGFAGVTAVTCSTTLFTPLSPTP